MHTGVGCVGRLRISMVREGASLDVGPELENGVGVGRLAAASIGDGHGEETECKGKLNYPGQAGQADDPTGVTIRHDAHRFPATPREGRLVPTLMLARVD